MEKCSQCITCRNVDLDKWGVHCMILHPLPKIKDDKCSSYIKEVRENEIKEEKTMIIKTSKYNEVSPKEIKRILEAGGKIIKDYEHERVGEVICTIDDEYIRTTDDIKINNIILPLALGNDEYFDKTIEIN